MGAVTRRRLLGASSGGHPDRDLTPDGGVLWCRADRPSRMIVEYATTESFGAPGASWGRWRSKNIVTEAKSKVAETLGEFRGNHRYNFPRRQPAALQCGSADDRPVGRPRGGQQLVRGEAPLQRFGPAVVFEHVPPAGRSNAAPSEGGCHFGHIRIDGKSGAITVTHRDAAGATLHAIDLVPT